jgi:AsmA protein
MKALKIAGIVIVVLILVVTALPFLINVNVFRPKIEAELSNALGRQVKIGNLKLSILSGAISADNLSISDDLSFNKTPFIQAKGLDVGVDIVPLIFSKTLHVSELTLDQPQVTLLRSPAGKWNFSSLGSSNNATSGAPPSSVAAPDNAAAKNTPAAQASPNPPPTANAAQTQPVADSNSSFTQNLAVGKLSIKDGQVSIGDTSLPGKLNVYRNVNVTVQNFSFKSHFPFSLTANLPSGGTLDLDGNAGPVNPEDSAATPLQAQLKINQLDLAKSGLIDPASGIGGLANFDGDLKSDGKTAHSTGNASLIQLKLVPKGSPAGKTVALKYSVNYDEQKQSGALEQGDVTIGKALAKLTGSFDTKASGTSLALKLNAQNMPVDDLESMLPALGVVLPTGSSLQGGTLSTTLAINGPLANLVVTGPIRLADTKLAGFNLGSKMAAISALTGVNTGSDTSIQNFSADLRYSPSGIQTQNVNLTVPALGVVAGDGSVSPQNALDYKMTAKLSGTAVSAVSQVAKLGTSGASVPFFVRGTTSDPKFEPDVKGMVSGALGNLSKNPQTNSVMNTLGGFLNKKKKTQ